MRLHGGALAGAPGPQVRQTASFMQPLAAVPSFGSRRPLLSGGLPSHSSSPGQQRLQGSDGWVTDDPSKNAHRANRLACSRSDLTPMCCLSGALQACRSVLLEANDKQSLRKSLRTQLFSRQKRHMYDTAAPAACSNKAVSAVA